jgi:hypothetical protein
MISKNFTPSVFRRSMYRNFRLFVLLGGLVLAISTARAQLTIMPLGDSITKGGGIGNDGMVSDGTYIQAGYRSQLYTDLTGANVNFTFQGANSYHATDALIAAGEQDANGYGSYTLADIYQNLAGASSSSNPEGGDNNEGGYWLTGGYGTGRAAVFPNIVLLMGGTNDIAYGYSLSTVETNMNDILTWFQTNRPDSLLIVSTVLPSLSAPGNNTEINAFNSWLVNTELPEFKTYTSVDMNALFTANESTYFSTDGVHPNATGYAAMGDAWSAAILDVVPEPSTWGMMGVGLALLMGFGWKTRKKRAYNPLKFSARAARVSTEA